MIKNDNVETKKMTEQIRNNKRIAKNTLFLYFRMFLTMGISIYISRVVLDTLGEVDYGIYNVVGGFVAMFTVISGAMTTATQRFISYEIGKGENGNVKLMFSTSVIIHIILGGIILLLGETLGLWFLNTYMNFPTDRLVAANWVYQLSLFTFIVNVISVPYNAAIVAYERMKAFAYVSIIDVCLKLIVAYLIVVASVDKLVLYAICLALIAVFIRVVYGWYCKKHFTECRCNWSWDKNNGKSIMSFVGWNMIGSIANIAKEQGVNVLLNIFFGAAVNAARAVAYQVLSAMNSFVNNFQMAMNPQIVKTYASSEKKEMFNIVFRGSRLSYLLLLTMSLPVILEVHYILRIWLKQVPEYTDVFIRLVLINALIDSISGPLIASMHASGKVRDYQIIVGGISLLNLPISYALFKLGYQPYSAMAVGIVVSVVCHFARLFLLKKSISFPLGLFVRRVTLRVLWVTIVSIVLPILVFYRLNDGLLSFIIVFVVSFLSTSAFSYIWGLENNERQFIINKILHLKK